jgi:hypothetical protein
LRLSIGRLSLTDDLVGSFQVLGHDWRWSTTGNADDKQRAASLYLYTQVLATAKPRKCGPEHGGGPARLKPGRSSRRDYIE